MPPHRRIKASKMTPAPEWARRSDDSVSNTSCDAPQRPPAGAKRDCGNLDMRIARDGTWYYKGSPIGRKELVCLFASVLKREEDGSYMLETPVERGRIEVEDAPFIAVEMVWRDCECGGAVRQCLSFRTNCDEVVPANADHPIRVQLCPRTREPRPYIMVRPGLEAKINRAVFYEMVALAVTETVDGRELMGVWSEGVFFPIDEAVADPVLAAE
ncbi:DUF1285 domain-containing protein [Roseococcus sp. SDR]|uniref:DUF1285 domain-containing protein n=1 Tax=Roseococcus sp. SDR TaxID=2835532 RepID=UPI00353050C8